jgi:hypothetical protein
MLLRIFRANSVYNYLLFPIIGGLLLLKSFLEPGIFPPESINFISPIFLPLYYLKIPFWGALVLNYIAVIIICIQMLYINATFSIVRERTFLPVYLFLFIVYSLPQLHVIQPVFFSAIFILFALISLFSSYEKKKTINYSFNAGFLTGISGLLYPASFILVFLIPISSYTLKNKVGWRDIIVSIIGLLLPLLYAFTYYFVFNKVSNFIDLFSNTIIKREETIFHSLAVLIYFSFLILIIFISSIFILRQYGEKKISIRRYFKILFFYFFASLLLFFLPSVSYELIVLLTIPLTFLVTNFLTFTRRKFWAELIFTLLLIISFLLQFFIK